MENFLMEVCINGGNGDLTNDITIVDSHYIWCGNYRIATCISCIFCAKCR